MRAIAVCAIAVACSKTDPPPAKTASGSSTRTSTSKMLGTPRVEMMPSLGGELLLAPAPTADGHQIHATWCLATDTFDSAVGAVQASLEDQVWTNITARGASITADREAHHVVVIVAALRAGPCAEPGRYRVTATLTTAGNR